MKKRIGCLLSMTLALSSLTTPNAFAADISYVDRPNVISAGVNTSAVVDIDGKLWMWGNGEDGQLSNSTPRYYLDWNRTQETVKAEKAKSHQLKPAVVMEQVGSVGADDWTAAVKIDGSLWSWGENNHARLGNGSYTDSAEPVLPIQILDQVVSVNPAYEYGAALKKDGSLWSWGCGDYGYLGNSSTNGTMESEHVIAPEKIMDSVSATCAGGEYGAAVKSDGTLWVWGNLSNVGIPLPATSTPLKIADDVAAACTGNLLHFIKNDNSLWRLVKKWPPTDSEGALIYDVKNVTFEKVMDNVAVISTGGEAGAAVQYDGSLWTWGENDYGQLGDGTTTNRSTPIKILDDVAVVSVGNSHMLAIKKDGSVWSWGNNDYGQIGNGGQGNAIHNYYRTPIQTVPVCIPGIVANVPQSNRFSVKLELNGGVGLQSVSCTKGELLTPPNTPLKTGSFFTGWYQEPSCMTPWDFAHDKPFNDNTVLYAGWNDRAALLEDARIGTSRIDINGELTALKTVVLNDEVGNEVNYVKLRDVATVLNTTSAQFNVGWEKSVTTIQPHTAYTTTNGSELQAPDASNAKLSDNPSPVFVEGIIAPIESFLLTTQDGGGHTYFKLRDLGKILNFDVTWDGVTQTVHIVTATK